MVERYFLGCHPDPWGPKVPLGHPPPPLAGTWSTRFFLDLPSLPGMTGLPFPPHRDTSGGLRSRGLLPGGPDPPTQPIGEGSLAKEVPEDSATHRLHPWLAAGQACQGGTGRS